VVACSNDNLAPSSPAQRDNLPGPSLAVAFDATPMLLAAGDIANCSRTQDNGTGDLIRSLLPSYPNAIVAPLGDLVYPYARSSDYNNCYNPAWGSFKSITRPVVGNHEYDSASTAQGYNGYFGTSVTHAPGMYYSYNIGTWHIVVLNTYSPKVSTKPGSPQDNWLISDLAANSQPCILGLMHHPRFFSSTNDTIIDPLEGFTSTPWLRLYNAGADLILTGHAHGYERFAPLTPDGVVDNAHGIPEIIVGTGGESQANFLKVHPASRVRSPKDTYGVLRLSLLTNAYAAKFLASSGTFTDDIPATGCHGAPPTAPPPNVAPKAAFSKTCTNLVCTFTDNSTDSDGIIKSRSWNFGDNTAVGSATPQSHTYAAAGTYTVTLTVTDDDGATNAVSQTVTVSPANVLPSAAFSASCSNLACTFTDQSTDSDGSIASRSWNFGDNSAAGTATPQSHTYAAGNTYQVTLTVTDNRGGTNALTKAVTVSAANVIPTPAFSASCTNLACTFTDQSTDSDGSIASRSWDFGDQTPAGTVTPQAHTYTTGNTYQVTLSVTDNRGGTNALTKAVTVSPANALPTAAFTANCPQDGLTCTFVDGSTDPDGNGTIASWKWEFGDGAVNTASTAADQPHDYSVADVYTVKLTVTDAKGGTNTATQTVTVGNPAPNAAPTAEFSFQCPAEGLTCTFADNGSIDTDGSVSGWSWDFSDGTSTEQKPSHTFAAGGDHAVTLTVKDNKGLASAPVTHTVTVTAPPPPANTAPTAAFTTSCTNLACTFTDQSSDPDQTSVSLGRSWNYGDNTSGTTASHTYSAGGNYTVTLTVTDNGGLTATANHPVSVSAANVSPTASFTASCTNLSCTFTDGSSDSDGSIVSRSWNFGDNTTSTATSPSKSYTAAGTYTVSLTVTDNRGGTGTISHSVTVSPANVAPTAEFTSSCTNLNCTFTDRSTDTDGTIATRSWNFGDNTTSTATNPTKSYTAAGTYTVRLTVTDNRGGTSTTVSHNVTVTAAPAPPPPSSVVLTVTKKASTTLSYALLDWTGATGDSVEVFRNSTPGGALLKIARTENDGHMGSTRSNIYEPITYTFQLCQKGQAPGQTGAVCSNRSSQTFP
jgi:PKD repeat protein